VAVKSEQWRQDPATEPRLINNPVKDLRLGAEVDTPVGRLRIKGPKGDQLLGPLRFQAFRDGGKKPLILLVGKQLIGLFGTFHNFNLSILKERR
jgi:hypothetical protein